MKPTNACTGCGSSDYGQWYDGSGPGVAVTEHTTPSWCDRCPPRRCDDCGEDRTLTRLCSCWLPFDGMALADIRAVFAADGTFDTKVVQVD